MERLICNCTLNASDFVTPEGSEKLCHGMEIDKQTKADKQKDKDMHRQKKQYKKYTEKHDKRKK